MHLRGLVHTRRPDLATDLLGSRPYVRDCDTTAMAGDFHVTTGEVLLACADTSQAEAAFQSAITIAEEHRLPHQIPRTLRSCTSRLPAVGELAHQALERLRIPASNPAGSTQAP
ncbi:hypothetical protein [Micromonospora sp. WMMD812]|uniref:hypothetical protein n=1 Tax=Micromonospora sp. WMMD812 TaxID=3015152 RepID=UPI00248D020F|nr:hypothetical protein [Micromonospora sp. WMMD812]WBB69090.1 hypothetical protein O7603_07000 [Micromonospora sp. WMMD812]